MEEGEYEGNDNPRDALDELREIAPVPSNPSVIERLGGLLTLGQALVGQVVDIPHGGTRKEIFTLRTSSDDLNSSFTVAVGQIPGANNFSGSTFDEADFGSYSGYLDEIGKSLYVLLEWGAGSVQFSALLDVTQEQQITISGSFLRATAVNNYSAPPLSGPAVPKVGAFVSLLPDGSKYPAKKTECYAIPATPIAAAGVINLRPPSFARTMKVLRAPFTAPFTVQYLNGGAGPEVAAAANQDFPEIPVPANVGQIAIVNGAVPITSLKIVWGLDL